MSALRPSATEVRHIAVSRSRGIRIDWNDGHLSEYSLAWLRDHCPCASCTGAHEGGQRQSKPSPFPIYKPALKLEDVQPVGAYAIQLRWNDGHSTGIYSFDYLREICPCAECRALREEGQVREAGS
ncbi:MAG: gamma-butyrobetaine hydroxylase-like domain-containing protein [Bryobacteraceae bacterium]